MSAEEHSVANGILLQLLVTRTERMARDLSDIKETVAMWRGAMRVFALVTAGAVSVATLSVHAAAVVVTWMRTH